MPVVTVIVYGDNHLLPTCEDVTHLHGEEKTLPLASICKKCIAWLKHNAKFGFSTAKVTYGKLHRRIGATVFHSSSECGRQQLEITEEGKVDLAKICTICLR